MRDPFLWPADDDVFRGLQGLGECDIAGQDPSEEQGLAGLVHGMNIQEPVCLFHPGL
jgi:hypothetical protein